MKKSFRNICLKICHEILGSNSFSNLRSSQLNVFMIYFGNGEKYFLALLIQWFSSKRSLYNNLSLFFLYNGYFISFQRKKQQADNNNKFEAKLYLIFVDFSTKLWFFLNVYDEIKLKYFILLKIISSSFIFDEKQEIHKCDDHSLG